MRLCPSLSRSRLCVGCERKDDPHANQCGMDIPCNGPESPGRSAVDGAPKSKIDVHFQQSWGGGGGCWLVRLIESGRPLEWVPDPTISLVGRLEVHNLAGLIHQDLVSACCGCGALSF